mmetsp:Transcript_36359/g.71556  ORF Transcript_36359/g.71556 Transcript_36359/m.71556 type:complete len:281 (-) Transcript_36359:140-982(-)
MTVTSHWRTSTRRVIHNLRPHPRAQVEFPEIVQVPLSIVTPKNEHAVPPTTCRGTVSGTGQALSHVPLSQVAEVLLGPSLCVEVILPEIVPVVPVVPREDVHGVLKHDAAVGMSCRRPHTLRWISPQNAPLVFLCIVLPEIRDATVAVITSKQVDAVPSFVCHSNVSISCIRVVVGVGWSEVLPLPCLEIVSEEIVHARPSVVASEDVHMLPQCHSHVERPSAGRRPCCDDISPDSEWKGVLAVACHVHNLLGCVPGSFIFLLCVQERWEAADRRRSSAD